MLTSMLELLRSQNMCVLATVADGVPHCSFMAYIADYSAPKLYMVTYRNTKKYENLTANPNVCLLVDTRLADGHEKRGELKALTVNGRCRFLADHEEKKRIKKLFITANSHLEEFATHPDAVVFQVSIESLQLLHGATQAYYEEISDSEPNRGGLR